jgi:fatty-acyl-CoA synthase
MGLFGTFVTPALHDVDIYLQAPEEFVRSPFDWLKTVSRLGATVTAAPDSGYRYILRRSASEQVGQLDLSKWRVAINGAEPIDPDTQRNFTSRFAAAGLAQNVFLPAYGLAEATLAVTFPPMGRATKTIKVRRDALGRGVCETITAEQESHRELVSVGHPALKVDVRVVGDDSVALGPDAVGEIEIRGAPVTPGYDRHPQATEAVLRRGGWVATGDLGVWHHGELYVVGRTKELVIILGVNHYASDIEAALHRIPDLPVRGILAQQIQTKDGGALGLVVESDEDDEDAKLAMTRRIREALAAELGIAPDRISYVARGMIPRTSSGKPLRR